MRFPRPSDWLVAPAMLAALALTAAPAHAQVMTFDAATFTGEGAGSIDAFSEAGFTLSAPTSPQFGFWCSDAGASGYSGSSALVINHSVDAATLVHDGGGTFSPLDRYRVRLL